MVQQETSISHILGKGAKWLGIIIIMGIATLLSFLFFQSIAPPDEAWFPYAALGLTEGGLVLWILVFRLTNYHPVEKGIALIMTGACLLASFSAAGYEFYNWMSHRLAVSQPPWIQQGIATVLEVMFFLHMIAFAIELISGGFDAMAKQGYSFRGKIPTNSLSVGNKISHTNGNLAPQVTVRELEQMISRSVTGYLTALPQGSESAQSDPLASRLLPRRKERVTLAHVGTVAAQGVSSLTRKAAGFIRRGSTAAPVPGAASEITSESTSPEESEPDALDVWGEAYKLSGAAERGIEFPDFVRAAKGLAEMVEENDQLLEE